MHTASPHTIFIAAYLGHGPRLDAGRAYAFNDDSDFLTASPAIMLVAQERFLPLHTRTL
jgi:hypothetical protein